MTDIATILRSYRWHAVSEDELQVAIAEVLAAHDIAFEREVDLGAGAGRIDFLAGDVGIEVKTKGGLSPLTRQIYRYVQHERIAALLVVTTRRQLTRLPAILNGKSVVPVYIGAL